MKTPTRTAGATPATARELLALVVDPGSFDPWDTDIVSAPGDDADYARKLADAQAASGHSESVTAGRARIDGRELVVISGNFGFLGGSVGRASGERVARAFERATAARLPVLTLVASGGTRIQEGAGAFVQMIKAVQAVRAHRRAGLLYVAYLGHPSMGGALASWGSLAHLTFAMPGALVGFSGPRVVEFTSGRVLPPGTQDAENLMRHGLIDDVFPPEQLRRCVDSLLSALEPRRDHSPATVPHEHYSDDGDAWASIRRSRARDRPGARDLLAVCATDLTLLRGDGQGGADDPACLAAIGRIGGIPAVVVGQDRAASETGARMTPNGYRKARRAILIASELRLPIVTIIDTPGAELSAGAEEGGLAAEIARCLMELTDSPSPTVSVLLGEGGGGGALALLPADRVLCAQNAWLSPIAPEGGSAIVHRSVDKAAQLAADLGIASWDLKRLGVVDAIVVEDADAGRDGAPFVARLSAALRRALTDVVVQDPEERLSARRRRLRAIGDA